MHVSPCPLSGSTVRLSLVPSTSQSDAEHSSLSSPEEPLSTRDLMTGDFTEEISLRRQFTSCPHNKPLTTHHRHFSPSNSFSAMCLPVRVLLSYLLFIGPVVLFSQIPPPLLRCPMTSHLFALSSDPIPALRVPGT